MYLQWRSTGLVNLYHSGIYRDDATVGTLESLLEIVRSYPMTHELYCKVFGLLSIVVSRHTNFHRDTLLNERLQQIQLEFVEEYLAFRKGRELSLLDKVFLPPNVGHFVTVLHYLLAYYKDTDKVILKTQQLCEL